MLDPLSTQRQDHSHPLHGSSWTQRQTDVRVLKRQSQTGEIHWIQESNRYKGTAMVLTGCYFSSCNLLLLVTIFCTFLLCFVLILLRLLNCTSYLFLISFEMQRTSALLLKYIGSTALDQVPKEFLPAIEAASKAVESEVSWPIQCMLELV